MANEGPNSPYSTFLEAFGWLAELGPYTVNAESMNVKNGSVPKVFHNEKSFDRKANVLIFEHPPGTGQPDTSSHLARMTKTMLDSR